jgi:hypothetical protein
MLFWIDLQVFEIWDLGSTQIWVGKASSWGSLLGHT